MMGSVSLINGHIDDDIMTPQEALEVIDKVHDYPCPYGIGGTAWMYIRDCIEKQIPQKTTKRQYVPNGTLIYGHCPNCDCFTKNSFKYCGICGQALDWSDNE